MPKTFTLKKLPTRLIDALLMQPWVCGPLDVFGNEMEGRKWVFIVGCYNSGTTLLAELLQAHSKLDGLRNEGAFLTDQLPYPERLGWPRMWSRCADEMRVSSDEAERARKIKKHWSLWIRGQNEYAVEKSISNTLRIEFLAKHFNEAKFIHIVRNGYAVAAGIRRKSNLRRWKNPDGLTAYPIDYCASQWRDSLVEVERCVDAGLPIVTISYEDVVSNTVQALSPVFEFIGVSPIVDANAWGELHIHEKSSRIKDMNAASIEQLDEQDQKIIESVAGDYLAKFGYAIP